MDDIDRAQAADTQHREQALKAMARGRTTGKSKSKCIDCEAPIPEARRKAVPGVKRCVKCEELIEKRRIG